MLVLFNKHVIKLCNVITQKTTICIFTTVRTSKYTFCRYCRQVNPICNTKLYTDMYTEYEIGLCDCHVTERSNTKHILIILQCDAA